MFKADLIAATHPADGKREDLKPAKGISFLLNKLIFSILLSITLLFVNF
jgi:hypothetical protein